MRAFAGRLEANGGEFEPVDLEWGDVDEILAGRSEDRSIHAVTAVDGAGRESAPELDRDDMVARRACCRIHPS